MSVLQEERKERLRKMERTSLVKARKEGDQYFASLRLNTKIVSTENFSSVFLWKLNSGTNRYFSDNQLDFNNLATVHDLDKHGKVH